jgi:ribonuclease BN (tRNA processing enzyme)
MQIQFLGAHKLEAQNCRHVNLLVDGVLAIEAGALTSTLTFQEQQGLKAVLLTHQHYDHVRDLPALGMNFFLHENTLDIYGTRPVYEALSANLLRDELYPNYLERPPESPVMRFNVMEPGRARDILGYSVLPVTVNHSVPTNGYQITSPEGKSFFYTSDTGPGLAECWRQVSPGLLIIEVTASDKYLDFAGRAGHLTPGLLRRELEDFRKIRGYLPPVIAVHMNPLEEDIIGTEVAAAAKALKADISLARGGMRLDF